MGVAIPQIITEDRASGALIVDGSLRFDGSKSQYLSRTPAVAGNRRTFTLSFWIKLNSLTGAGGAGHSNLYMGGNGSNDNEFFNPLILAGGTGINVGAYNFGIATTNAYFRDISAWYHIVIAVDTTQSAQIDKLKVYQNGVLLTFTGAVSSSFTTNFDTGVNNTTPQFIGELGTSAGLLRYYPYAQFSQYYLIDGQALDSSYFGYTDALTNTWRPKKLSSSVAFGTNGFYLPFDGSAPIGQDQSGRGNNWTPVNFGGSNTLEKATGALPILNTDGGGKVARVGVRTDSSASSLVLALPLVGVKDDVSNRINSGSTTKTVTATNAVASSAQSNFYGGSFYFDGSGDYLNAGTSTDFVFGTGQFTIEGWIYNQSYNGSNGGTGDSYPTIISTYSGETVNWIVRIYRTGALTWYSSDGGGTNNNSAGGLTQLNTWYHFAYVREGTGSNQFKMYLNGVLVHTLTDSNNYTANETVVIGSQSASNPRNYHTGYLQDFRIYKGLAKYTQNFIPASTDPDILPDTPSGVSYSSNLTQITDGAVAFDGSGDYLSLADSADLDLGNSNFTIEGFVYVNSTSGSQQTFVAKGTGANNQASYHIALNTSGNWVYYLSSNGSTWDIVSAAVIGTYTPNAWQHITLVRSGNTFTPYLNGVAGTPTTSSATLFDSNKILSIGADDPGNQLLFGFISNAHIVKGTALYTSNFTPPTGPISSVANTKLLCCKSNSSATAFDVSPGTITANGNAAATNFNPFTVNINTQRGKQSGWCTLNPLDVYGTVTFSNGNLTINPAIGSGNAAFGSLPVTSGKWYWEVTVNTDSALGSMIGITDYQYPVSRRSWYSTSGAQGWFYYADGSKYTPGNPYSASSYGSSYTTADVISIALNMDAGTCVMYKNGISQGTLTSTGLSGNLIGPALGQGQGGTSGQPVYSANFGQKPFKFPPPAGFQPLALANTPRPTIVRPDQFVGVSTWSGAQSGSGGLTRQISLGMQPDFVWIKQRNQAYTTGHQLYDSVRGAGAEKELNSSGTAAEGAGNIETYGWLNSFDKTGFTVKGGSSDYDYVDKSGVNYVAWTWKAGGNSNTYNINDVGYATASAAGLTAGTITPTGASVNTKSGFSIITYTGTGSAATISHGGLVNLSNGMIIVKNRSSATNWRVYHSAIGNTKTIFLSTTGGTDTSSVYWNNTSPTSTVFSVGSDDGINGSGNSMVAYCWAEIPGFSKFGSYTGNGSADGPMVITGFRPRWIMIKRTDSADDWNIFDTTRSTYNVMGHDLLANRSDAEYTGTYIDSLSNGFKIRETNTSRNASGGTYIYAAFAETPTQNLYGAQANAR